MYKLLIVDDEPLVRVGVQSMLDWTSLDIEIIGTARNGSHAEELMRSNMPDIVIADIKMPIKSGLQLAQDSYNRNGRIPVFIMLTSFEEFEYAQQALQAQAVDYLIKMELDAEKLENAVKNAIVIIDRNRTNQPGIPQSERSSIQTLREKFFIRLLNDLFDNDDAYDAQIRDLDIDILCDAFVVADCTITLPQQDTQEPGRIISLYNNAMRLVRETLTRYIQCFVVPLDTVHFTVIFCLDSQTGEEQTAIQQILYQTAAALQDYLSIQMYSAVGQRVDSLRQISTSYRQAQRCIHGITADDPVVFYKENHTEHVVESVKAYIRENLGKRLSLQEVAAVFNFNPNYLSHLFAKYAGVGFVEYITGVRITAAKELLTQDKLRIYEIAELLGFEDSFYFSKVFKKVEGLSPSEYIHKNR